MGDRKEVNLMVGDVRRNCEKRKETIIVIYEKNISIKGKKEKYERTLYFSQEILLKYK